VQQCALKTQAAVTSSNCNETVFGSYNSEH